MQPGRLRTGLNERTRHHSRHAAGSPGQEQAFTAWLRELADVAKHYPGHQGVTIIPPPFGADDREYVIIFRFNSQAHLRLWQASDERRAMLVRSKSMADEPPVERELTGLETWFAVPGGQVRQPPPAWKMCLLSGCKETSSGFG